MNHSQPKTELRNGLSLIELAVALAIVAILFAVLLPQFRNIQNGWASRQGGAEALQNGRILTDHLQMHLSKAVRITAVSPPAEDTGYIEYEDAEGSVFRYEMGNDEQVLFGPVGNLAELAGPAGGLQFACYGLQGMDTPITDVELIRVVRVHALLLNNADNGQDKPFETLVYLRSNVPNGIVGGASSTFGITTGNTPALAGVDPTHFLCAFTGQGDDGWATVLTVDVDAQTVASGPAFEYDNATGVNPSLAPVDATRFLCAYKGPAGDGWAVVLAIDPQTWTVSRGEPLEFDNKDCSYSSLSRIDATRFLCAYTGGGDDGYAVILQVDPDLMTVSMGAPCEFDPASGETPVLQRFDSNHALCVYQGWSGWLWAVVLRTDTATLTVSRETPCALGLGYSSTPALSAIDTTHFLCAYTGTTGNGMAVVLTVHPGSWLVTRATPFQYDGPVGRIPALVQLTDNTRYLCAYQGSLSRLWATVLVVDPVTWDIRSEHKTALSSWKALRPDLARIDSYNYLCVHEDQVNAGWGLILNVGGIRP